ncbi:hypothetical protein [Neptunicoccus cionae]|uniref:Uncharacterized protein n=1 Tax=Neptunicoccus cionae TaxID=2035344 RepID=A0A916QWC7_9RHOB|nr:hypothetical protein [Amylibacter cionae]GGA12619.1 hypothetical protein GCM10011498_10650 [Amylibacter cionae]
MPELESVRTTAEAIGRITCIKTGEEIGLLYQWDNGDTQAALHEDGLLRSTICPERHEVPDLGANRG